MRRAPTSNKYSSVKSLGDQNEQIQAKDILSFINKIQYHVVTLLPSSLGDRQCRHVMGYHFQHLR